MPLSRGVRADDIRTLTDDTFVDTPICCDIVVLITARMILIGFLTGFDVARGRCAFTGHSGPTVGKWNTFNHIRSNDHRFVHVSSRFPRSQNDFSALLSEENFF